MIILFAVLFYCGAIFPSDPVDSPATALWYFKMEFDTMVAE